MISKTKYYSWKSNSLAKGCQQCIIGRKLVVFVTGICPKNCFYCPISEQKKNKDVIYANERRLHDENDVASLVEEAKVSRSHGASFTGGDPLTRIDRTCKFIRILKKNFGKEFHTHLYTILETVSKDKLKKLESAGLDELRLHPDIMDEKFWKNIELFYEKNRERKYSFDLGIEIPSIPGFEEKTKRLLEYFAPFVDFININELEISDTNSCKLIEKRFTTKDRTSYAVKGSSELGLRLLRYINDKFPKKNTHFCTCKLKDKIQLRERLKIRAESIKRIFDIVTPDGTMIRGCIYLKKLAPGFSYIRTLENISDEKRKKIIQELKNIRDDLIANLGIPENMLEVDIIKPRIITNIGIARKLGKYLKNKGLIPAIVEQYPSYDQMEVDVEFI